MDYASFTASAEFHRDTELPRFKGSMLHGAMGHALKSTVCAVRVKVCETCLLRPTCVYARVFEVKPNPDQATSQVNLPHPYVLDGSEMSKQFYETGERFRFTLLLFGGMIDLLPYFIYTFESMGCRGLGRRTEEGRSAFSLKAVHMLDKLIYDPHDPFLPSPIPRQTLNLSPGPGDEDVERLRLYLQTPLRVKDKGRFASDLDFPLLLRAIVRRLKALKSEFCETPFELPLQELFDRADEVKVTGKEIRWEEQTRYSSRQNSRQLMGGLRGHISLEGGLTLYMPLLRAAEVVHIGKETSFGLGKVVMEVL